MQIINTKESREVVAQILSVLRESKEVKVTGLGIFKVKRLAARQGRNPKTGEIIQVPAKNKLAFRASLQILKELQ